MLIDLALACAVILAGAVAQAASGVGAGLLVVPLLLFIRPDFVPAPVLLSSMVLSGSMAFRGRKEIVSRGLPLLVAGLVAGSIVAAFVVAALRGPATQMAIGGLLCLAVILSVIGFRLPGTGPARLAGGAVSAFMGTVAAVGGPVLALMYQDESGPSVRATLAWLYLVASAIMLLALWSAGRVGQTELLLSAGLVPGWLLGYGLSPRLATFLDRGHTRAVILAMAGASALLLIVRAAVELAAV